MKISTLNKYSEYVLLPILILYVLLTTINRKVNLDMWYDIKAGELFTQKGIQFHDVFSNSAFGRQWIPNEWLYQITIYYFQKIFGLQEIGLFVAFFSVLQIILIYFFIKKAFSLKGILLFLICLFYFIGVSDYLIPRPTVVANLFFVAAAFIVLLYIYKSKNYLWVLLPLTIIWSNLHGSFIFSLVFLAGYTLVCFLYFFITKEIVWVNKSRILALYTLITFLLTFLPPLVEKKYTIFLPFIEYHNTLTSILEWQPLYNDQLHFYVYSLLAAVTVSMLFYIYKKDTWKKLVLFAPIGILIFIPYLADRNLLYGIFGLVILISILVEKIQLSKNRLHLLIAILILLLGIVSYGAITSLYSTDNTDNYPTQATSFIMNYHLQGNMFNSYKYGSYLLYRLYPQQKVFIDGRSDVYVCCEMPLLNKLNAENMSDSEFENNLYSILSKYNISFVLITRESAVQQKIIDVLSQDNGWFLVFWDDNSQIFVKNDRKNNQLLQQFALRASTPNALQPFNIKKLNQALFEYTRMANIADSAKSRNDIGLIMVKQKRISDATAQFEKAIQVNANYVPPYYNLAAIAIAEKNYDEAVTLYKKALSLNNQDPQVYMSLAILYSRVYNNPNEAKEIIQQGITTIQNPTETEQLQQFLSNSL